MIFKFDKVGNMEDVGMEGDIDMGRKSNKDKDKFQQVDVSLVNQVKEEVLNGMSETQSQVAAGFESLDEIVGDEDMVQKEMELVKEMESESDKIWDRGSRDGVVGDSVGDDENESDKSVMSDEELKQKMRERNMGNVGGSGSKPAFGSLSEITKLQDENNVNDFSDEDETKEQKNEAQRKKDELAKKREANKLKKEFKDREKQLAMKKESNDKSWSFDNISVVMRDGTPYKFNLSLSALQLAEMYGVTGQIYYQKSIQRGSKVSKTKGEIPLINVKHSKDILNSLLESENVDGGTIYLNYAKEYSTPLQFNSSDNTLSGQFPLSINDGGHRLESCLLWYNKFRKDMNSIKDPNDFYFSVSILNLDHEQSENIFVELNSLGLPVSKTAVAYHDVRNINNVIAKKVMNNSFLRGRIELFSNSLKKTSNCVMTFNTLLKGCSMMSPETPSQVEEAGNFLCSYFNEIIELFPKIYGNVSSETRQIEKANTFIGEVMFIQALFGLAVELQFVSDWKDKLKRLKEPNFLSRNNDLWIRNITRNEGKLINTSKTQDFVKDQLLAKVLG